MLESTPLDEIYRKLATGRFDPIDTERVSRDEVRYLVRRLETAEAVIQHLTGDYPPMFTQAWDAWKKAKEGTL